MLMRSIQDRDICSVMSTATALPVRHADRFVPAGSTALAIARLGGHDRIVGLFLGGTTRYLLESPPPVVGHLIRAIGTIQLSEDEIRERDMLRQKKPFVAEKLEERALFAELGAHSMFNFKKLP